MQHQQNLILTTDRLLLRPLELDDLEMLWPDISDAKISKLMAWEVHTDKSQTAEFLKAEVERRSTSKGVTWVILKNESFCGIISLIGLIRSHRALTYNKAELAYWLSRKFQGQGIMTEAGRCVLRFAFQDLRLHKVVVSHFANNQASENLIIRLGFKYVGTQIKEFQKNGIWYDHKLYELLEDEVEGCTRMRLST
jgi:RimJ/RimL family protein N-acetyltransferase